MTATSWGLVVARVTEAEAVMLWRLRRRCRRPRRRQREGGEAVAGAVVRDLPGDGAGVEQQVDMPGHLPPDQPRPRGDRER